MQVWKMLERWSKKSWIRCESKGPTICSQKRRKNLKVASTGEPLAEWAHSSIILLRNTRPVAGSCIERTLLRRHVWKRLRSIAKRDVYLLSGDNFCGRRYKGVI